MFDCSNFHELKTGSQTHERSCVVLQSGSLEEVNNRTLCAVIFLKLLYSNSPT